MSSDHRAVLELSERETRGSREGRRLRLLGEVPGVLYGRGREPQTFSVNERALRAALKEGHALLDAHLGSSTVPVIVKDQQHHPVKGGYTHIDLLEVDLKQTIQSVVAIELVGVEDSPGVVQGGVLDHVTREIHIEALPTDIPDMVTIDVSALELNSTFLLSAATIPSNLTVLDDPDETVIATVSIPALVEASTDEVEEETELVGEAAAETDESGDADGE